MNESNQTENQQMESKELAALEELGEDRPSADGREREQNLEEAQFVPKGCIQVVARLRPDLQSSRGTEASAPLSSIVGDVVQITNDQKTIEVVTSKHRHSATLDHIFDSNTTQEDIFQYVKPSIDATLQGYNCSIFVYGQTGTGKTYTMLGKEGEAMTSMERSTTHLKGVECPTTWGLIPRTAVEIFRQLSELQELHQDPNDFRCEVTCSYIQIYNDKVYDLLQDRRCQKPLQIHEHGNKTKDVYIQGLSEYRVANENQVLNLIDIGCRNRAVRATEYNEHSSRSHLIVQINLEIEQMNLNGVGKIVTKSKLNLVDLAGSEKWNTSLKTSSYDLERFTELTHINQSLSTLGNVIGALSDSSRKHIPFRDSKLTRILQDSLGGNTCTTILTTLSTDEASSYESASTIHFADRAKNVKMRARKNRVVDDAELLLRAQKEIHYLREMIKTQSFQRVAQLEEKMRALEAENQRLKDQVSSFIIQPPIVGQDDAKLTKTPPTFHPLERVKQQMDEEQATSHHGLTKLDDTPDETPENHRKKVKEALKDHEALQTNLDHLIDLATGQRSNVRRVFNGGRKKRNSGISRGQSVQREWNDGGGGRVNAQGKWEPSSAQIPDYTPSLLTGVSLVVKKKNVFSVAPPKQRGEVKGVITKKANQFMNSLLVSAKQALSSSSSSSSPSSSSSSLRSRKSYRVATTKSEDSQIALASDEHLEREES